MSAFVAVFVVFFQNCGNINLQQKADQASLACVIPDAVDSYSVGLYNQTSNADSFEILDGNGQATNLEADWSVDGVDEGRHVVFESDFAPGSTCANH